MDTQFWHQRWERSEIGFHEGQPNYFLVRHINQLKLEKGNRVFIPLCGKTRDIAWLLAQGYHVTGAELSTLAVDQLFEELGIMPDIITKGKLLHYHGNNIDIFAGNIFDLSADMLGQVNAVYDRAALVALPADIRQQYTRHLPNITATSPQLLVTFEYDQTKMDGPPFSVSAEEISRLYGAAYRLEAIESRDVENGLKGVVAATETAWLLSPIR